MTAMREKRTNEKWLNCWLVCICLLILATQNAVLGQEECETSELGYSCKKQMTDFYALHWSLGPTTDGARAGENELAIAMVGDTTGWVGFAFAEVEGEMSPADFVVGWVDDSGEVVAAPYRSEIRSITASDEDSNVTLSDIRGSEEDGQTTIRFVRSLTEGTTEILVDEFMPVNIAIGSVDGLEYHGPDNRLFTTVMLLLALEAEDSGSTITEKEATTGQTRNQTQSAQPPSAEPPSAMSGIAPMSEESSGCQSSDLGYRCSIELTDGMIMHWTLGPSDASGDVPEVGENQVAMAVAAQTTGWIGISFPEIANVMVPAEGVIGWQTESGDAFLQHYTLTSRAVSGVVAADNQAISEKSCSQEDGATTMTFVYDLTTLSQKINPAEAPINWAYRNDDEFDRHDERGGTVVNLLGVGKTAQEETAPTPETGEQSESTTAATADTSMSPAGGCVGSDLGYTCTQVFLSLTLHWTVGPRAANEDVPEVADGEVAMALVAPTTGWVGIGFAQSAPNMAPADVVLGWVDTEGATITGYRISSTSINENEATADIGIREKQGSEIDGTTTIQFVLTGEFTFPVNLQGDINLNNAHGSVDRLDYHRTNRESATVNLVSGSSTVVNQDLKYHRTHGSMMIIAWVGLAPVGILIARNKDAFRGISEGAWFQIHRVVQLMALCFMFVGMVIALSEFDDPATTQGKRHRRVGISVLVLGFLQGTIPFFRPTHESPHRFVFNYVHWYLGRGCVILGIVNVFLGMKAYDLLNRADIDIYWITCVVVLGVYFCFAAIGELVLAYNRAEGERAQHRGRSQQHIEIPTA